MHHENGKEPIHTYKKTRYIMIYNSEINIKNNY